MAEVTVSDAFNATKSTFAARFEARKALRGEALTRFEIIAAFAIDVITRIRERFADPAGNIKEPGGFLKGIRFAGTGIWLIIRVIKLIRDLK